MVYILFIKCTYVDNLSNYQQQGLAGMIQMRL